MIILLKNKYNFYIEYKSNLQFSNSKVSILAIRTRFYKHRCIYIYIYITYDTKKKNLHFGSNK